MKVSLLLSIQFCLTVFKLSIALFSNGFNSISILNSDLGVLKVVVGLSCTPTESYSVSKKRKYQDIN